jgi:hypothetical protein
MEERYEGADSGVVKRIKMVAEAGQKGLKLERPK